MSAIRKDQLENASAFMTDFWKNFVKPYYNAPDYVTEQPEDYWHEFIDVFGKIGNKYCLKDKKLKAILFAFEKAMEDEDRENRKKG